MWSSLMLATALTGTASAQDESDDSHSAVVIILDGSGSMKERFHGVSRMDAAKKALKVVLSTLPEDTDIGLLVFGARKIGQRGPWTYQLGKRQDGVLMPAIDQVFPAGGTPLGEYIKIGADALLEDRKKNLGYGTYRLLVVTDGEATDGKMMERFAPEVVDRGIVLDVIGVDMKQSHTLKKMATSYRAADRPEELVEAVREVLAEVSFGDDSTADAEVFELLDGLPDNFAMAAIESLASGTQNNRPIGSPPPKPPTPERPASNNTRASSTPGSSSSSCSTAPAAGTVMGGLLGLSLVARRRR